MRKEPYITTEQWKAMPLAERMKHDDEADRADMRRERDIVDYGVGNNDQARMIDEVDRMSQRMR